MPCDGAGHDNAAHAGCGGGAQAVLGILKDHDFSGRHAKPGGGMKEKSGVGLGTSDIVQRSDIPEAASQPQAVKPAIDPGGTGTAGNGAWQAGGPGVFKQFADSRHGVFAEEQFMHAFAAAAGENFPVQGSPEQRFQRRSRIIMAEITANTLRPDFDFEWETVILVEVSPSLIDGGLGVENEAVKIEDERLHRNGGSAFMEKAGEDRRTIVCCG